jgi:hypothetical protein
MKDPVILPTSGNTVDRSTIKRILLDDNHDPFNRAPLNINQVEDDLVMQQRIETWKRQKLAGEVTDEERREQAELEAIPAVVQEETSSMSVDKPVEEATPPPEQTEVDYNNLSEEEQMKMAMEMSMKDFQGFR